MTAIPNLYCKYRYPVGGSNLPIVFLMHGWATGAESLFYDDIQRVADYGFFVAVPGMRGRSGAGGSRDASAREIFDIYDALAYIRSNYADLVHPTNAAIVGYSGGGGNALAAACKFPDVWTVVVSHFGVSDYGRDGTDGWWANNGGSYTASIESSIGGTPAVVPNNYYARDATAAIPNFTGGALYLYHDTGDTTVPSVHSSRIDAAMTAAGLANCTLNLSTALDEIRWEHGSPTTNPDLITAEPTWRDAILGATPWTVAAAGTLTVIGYIVTKRFTIWLNANGTATAGIDAAATVVYNTATDTYTVTPLTGAIDVTITQGAKTGSATNITEATAIVVS